jgi:cytochrome c-type biogenesis protein CcmE
MKIILPILLACLVLFWMINNSINESANKVVRVPELVEDNQSRSRVRLGARLTNDEIIFKTEPERIVQFVVTDMKEPEKGKIKVEYKGVMPDTLREGRDVIMEGSFSPEAGFLATTLSTQCPSKYQPPDPLNNSPENKPQNY